MAKGSAKEIFRVMQKTGAQNREGGRLNPFKYFRATCIEMGRSRHGRIGPIDQSQKKPKFRKDKQRGKAQYFYFDGPNYDKYKTSAFFLEDFVDAMKRINPKLL